MVAPYDIEILGFHLSDPKLGNKVPDIKVGGQKIPLSAISLQQDRIQIKLPSAIRDAVRFGDTTCSPREGFPIELTVFSSNDSGWWKLWKAKEVSLAFRSFVLPAPDYFTADVTYDGNMNTHVDQPHTYSHTSGNITMGCEESKSTIVPFTVPVGAAALQCSASWVETSNLKASSQNCAVGGNVVTGTGSATGLDRDCYVVGQVIGWVFGERNVCNCRGGGSGKLQISGTYNTTENSSTLLKNVSAGSFSYPGKSEANYSLPNDSSVSKTAVDVNIHRRECTAQFDHVHIAVPANPHSPASANSEKGFIKAQLINDQMSLKMPE